MQLKSKLILVETEYQQKKRTDFRGCGGRVGTWATALPHFGADDRYGLVEELRHSFLEISLPGLLLPGPASIRHNLTGLSSQLYLNPNTAKSAFCRANRRTWQVLHRHPRKLKRQGEYSPGRCLGLSVQAVTPCR